MSDIRASTKSVLDTISFNNNIEGNLGMLAIMQNFAILMEYQLLDLQHSVREFVTNMNDALQTLDMMVAEEGKHAQSLFEGIFNSSEGESKVLNERANARVDDIIADLLKNNLNLEGISEDLKDSLTGKSTPISVPNENAENQTSPKGSEAQDALWSKIVKKLESVSLLEERLRPQVYTIISCLSFEDIQTQRLDHLLKAYKHLNSGISKFIKENEGSLESKPVSAFAKELLHSIFNDYTMDDERKIFDHVFLTRKANACNE